LFHQALYDFSQIMEKTVGDEMAGEVHFAEQKPAGKRVKTGGRKPKQSLEEMMADAEKARAIGCATRRHHVSG
jgi:hypothetical protein